MVSVNKPIIPCRPFQNADMNQSFDFKLLPFACLCRESLGNTVTFGMSTETVTASQLNSSVSLIEDLMRYGVAIIDLSDFVFDGHPSNVPAKAFSSARMVMDQFQHPEVSVTCPLVPIDDNVNSAHVYGYHSSGGMISKRYNQFREGFIFSDLAKSFDVSLVQSVKASDDTTRLVTVPTTFRKDCHSMFELLHVIADTVLMNIANHFHLPNDWFQRQYGPTIDHCQWHIKRYVPAVDESVAMNDESVLLPIHTDPSLVSVVILDQPHIQIGGMGLQYLLPDKPTTDRDASLVGIVKGLKSEWMEVPWSGHNVAIVFVGSVLQYVTKGYFMAAKHRVVHKINCIPTHRVAATLFCRPAPLAHMVAPPECESLAGDQKMRHPITFESWMKKTAKNYEKSQMKKGEVLTK